MDATPAHVPPARPHCTPVGIDRVGRWDRRGKAGRPQCQRLLDRDDYELIGPTGHGPRARPRASRVPPVGLATATGQPRPRRDRAAEDRGIVGRAAASTLIHARGCIMQAYRAEPRFVDGTQPSSLLSMIDQPPRRDTMGALEVFSLTGLVALIAGGGGGIGSALAEACGAGARVVVAGRTQEPRDATVERAAATGVDALSVVADVTNEADCDRMVRETSSASADRHPRQRRRRRRRQGPPSGRGLSAL